MTSRRFRSPPRGFTLLEVMIVVGMAALVMAISIPFIQRTIHRDAVYHAVRVVEEACANARASAIVHNAVAEVVIQPEERRFSVRPGASRGSVNRRQSAATAAAAAARARAGDSGDGENARVSDYSRQAPPPFSGQLGDDVSIEILAINLEERRGDPEASVRFFPNGTSDEFTLFLRIGAVAAREITLDMVTGHPTVKVIR